MKMGMAHVCIEDKGLLIDNDKHTLSVDLDSRVTIIYIIIINSLSRLQRCVLNGCYYIVQVNSLYCLSLAFRSNRLSWAYLARTRMKDFIMVKHSRCTAKTRQPHQQPETNVVFRVQNTLKFWNGSARITLDINVLCYKWKKFLLNSATSQCYTMC